MAEADVVELNADNWIREVVNSNQPVLVDFWGPGCPPCVKLAPIIDNVARQFAGRAKVGKVNVSENFDLANEYGINSIPRVMLFKGGKKPLRQFAGLVPERELVKLLNEALK